MRNVKVLGLALVTLALVGLPAELMAQAPRRPTGPAPAGGAGGAVPEILKKDIKIEHSLTQTPEYDVNTTENKSARQQWGVVTVQYETLPEWVDELEFRFYVAVQNKKTSAVTLFPLTVTYVDIPKGKHTATVFLRPNTLTRHGPIVRAAVEVMYRGGVIGRESIPAMESRWWEQAGITRVEGILLGRSQTPFAFVSWDNYEAEKVVPGR